MLTSLDNMGNQVLAMQAQTTATATATAQTAKISKLLADPWPFNGSISKFEEWWAKVKAWQAENHLAMPANMDKLVRAVLSCLEGPKARSFAKTRLEMLNSRTTYTWTCMCTELEELSNQPIKRIGLGRSLGNSNKKGWWLMNGSSSSKPIVKPLSSTKDSWLTSSSRTSTHLSSKKSLRKILVLPIWPTIWPKCGTSVKRDNWPASLESPDHLNKETLMLWTLAHWMPHRTRNPKWKLTHSLEEKGKPEPLIAIGNRSLVSIVESQAIRLKNARFRPPNAQNVTGLEKATSQDAPKHLRSAPPPKNPLRLGIRDSAPFKEWALTKPRPFSTTCTMSKTREKPKRFDRSGWSKWLSICTYDFISKL